MFDTLPTEIITHIYLSLPSISATLALASTCHRFHNVFHTSKRLLILSEAAESEFGPVDDIIQLLTHNYSQAAHVHRTAPMSDALIQQVVRVGRVARAFETIYPFKKWKTDFANRRLLKPNECYVFRRALYRRWLFDEAFHARFYDRTCRSVPRYVHDRAALLHNYSTVELAELLDVHRMLRDVVANNICPSNGKIRQKFHKRHPESNHQLLLNVHLDCAPPAASSFARDGWFDESLIASANYHARLQPSRWHEPGAEGWGDDISHYYVVEDMMKLNPEQILFLRDRCLVKSEVEAYLREHCGDWFVNNGETLSETVGFVVKQRGGEMEAMKLAIEGGEMGVAVIGGHDWSGISCSTH